MFIVFLRFSDNRTQAAQFMEGHNAWIKRGFDSGTFLLAGSLQPNVGGTVFAHNIDREDLDALVQEDPFVAERVVSAEIHEITPGRVDERLAFLKG
ncbi:MULTISPECIES: YciI family protein [unclassified Sinorhizobium]|uniref:YciI family protein n=1 Tax=unclassified Sinorhizobium TaxID=2613772 RepID=UPI003526B08D